MQQRPPRLFWACTACLMDTSSGASIAIRELLRQLAAFGWEICILGSTVFDAASGSAPLRSQWDSLMQHVCTVVRYQDGNLTHNLLPVKSTDRHEMTSLEEEAFLAAYTDLLDKFRPDMVFTYGGHCLELCMADEATDRHIPMAFFLVNGNYQGTRWCRDIDMILTDSRATSDYYRKKYGIVPVVFGAPINPESVVAENHQRKNVLFVNPSYAKGVSVAILLATLLEEKRPDITFEILESRGSWKDALHEVTTALGTPRTSLRNVMVTPHTQDMRQVYARAKLLLAPSLWFESFGRVTAEAMMNGIPAIVTNRGGLPEVIGNGGIVVNFPPQCYEPPYRTMIGPEQLAPLADFIERCWDDPAFYQTYCHRVLAQGARYAAPAVARRFMRAVAPLMEQRAGDRPLEAPRARKNKQLQS